MSEHTAGSAPPIPPGFDATWYRRFYYEFVSRMGMDPTEADIRYALAWHVMGRMPELAADGAIDLNHPDY